MGFCRGEEDRQLSVHKNEIGDGHIHERSKEVDNGKDSGEAISKMLRKAEVVKGGASSLTTRQ